MRRHISWLVLATTSTVIVSFVIPLCLLVRNLAEERAIAATNQEARNVAIVVTGLHDRPKQLATVFASLDARDVAQTGVLTPDGVVLGDDPNLASDPNVRRALTGESFTVRDRDGFSVLIPVIVQDRDDQAATAVVRSSVTAADLHRGVTTAWAGIIGLGVALFALSLALASRLGRRISEPLREVAGVAHQLREGDLGARARVRGTEETRELAGALNGLAERTRELLAAERAAVGDLSHRLRTPVTALRLDAEAVTEPELAERLQEHIATLQVTIDAIVSEARRPVRSNLAARCDATAAVRDRLAFWEALAEDQERTMRVSLPDGPVLVPLAESDLTDAVDVLIDNVFAHTPERTPFAVTLLVNQGGASLIVADAGPGLASGGRTERPGSTGLGLDIVRRTAESCGGRLILTNATTGGTHVEIRLPLTES